MLDSNQGGAVRLPRYCSDKDFQGGLILLLIGGGVLFRSQAYTIGSLTHMGPGFFPASLGVVLTLVGLAMIGTTIRRSAIEAADRAPQSVSAPLAPEWRGWICICLGVIAFAVLGKHAGLIPAAFACVFVTALADRDNSIRDAVLLAAGVTVAGVIVFWWGLQVLLPLVAWNFG